MDDSVKSSVRVLSAATRHFTTLGAAVSVLFFCRRFEVNPLQGGKGAEPGKHIGELLTQVLGRALLWARYRFGDTTSKMPKRCKRKTISWNDTVPWRGG